jgi:K+/H+ antiporter YhaU regulatory subunit KhtT
MEKKIRTESRYHEIAVSIAGKISDGDIPEGKRIRSRTDISNAYGVSPETARKAMVILGDLGIVESRQGSGVYVASRKKAAEFADRFNDVRTIHELRKELKESIQRQQAELSHYEEIADRIEKVTSRSKKALAFSPLEMTITDSCLHLRKTIGSMNLWNRTGATVVAIARNDEYIISPGPQASLQTGDVLYFVGDASTKQRLYAWLYEKEEKTIE